MKQYFCFLLLLVFASCREDKPDAPAPTLIGKGVYISNEGNFQWGNAAVTYYNPQTGKASDDLFFEKNQRPLGDVGQSITAFNNRFYIVVNNSSKVEIVESTGFLSIGVINGLLSPRYLLPVNNSKAYVSDIYSNTIHVVNLNTNTVVKEIACKGWTEEMLLHDSLVLVTNVRSNYLYRVNINSDAIDSVLLGSPSASLVRDKNKRVWVLCTPIQQPGAQAKLIQLNAAASGVAKTFDLGTNAGKALRINGSGDRLYWTRSHVWRMDIAASSIPAQPFITKQTENFYTLGVDPVTEDVYASDALDYVQKGLVKRYSKDGALISSFKTGIIPGNIILN